MRDYEETYINILYGRMKGLFKGKCYCTIKDDILTMGVFTKECGTFTMSIADFSNKFILGMNTDLLLYDFMMKYSKWIQRRFIKC